MANGLPIQQDYLPLPMETADIAAPTSPLPLPSGAGTVAPDFSPTPPAGRGRFLGLTPEQIQILAAGFSDALSGGISGKVGTALPSLLAGQRAARTEERLTRTEERAAQSQALNAAINLSRERRELDAAQRSETKLIMDDALSYLQGAEGLSPDAREARENRLLVRMTKTSPADVITLRTMLSDRTFAEDITVLLRHMNPREVNELQTKARFVLTKEGGKKSLRETAETFASDDVLLELRNYAFNVSRRLRGEGAPGTLNRDELRKSLLDGGSPAVLAMFEGTRFSEDTRKAAEDVITGVGFGPRGVAAEAAKAGAVAGAQERAKRPFFAEEEVLKLQQLRTQVQQGATADLPSDVRAELKRAGVEGKPTPKQVGAAIDRAETNAVARSAAQGREAANIPARTPAETLKRVEELTASRSILAEMKRLAPRVDLPNLVGGATPWLNQIIQTGRVGAFPVPSGLAGKLTPEQDRFLALTQDYADSVLRLRSGATINEAEFQRMLGFLTERGVKAETFMARMDLQNDLLRVRGDVLQRVTESGGYRAPKIEPPSLTEGKAATHADMAAALKDAGGDKTRARDLLIQRGFDPTKPFAR